MADLSVNGKLCAKSLAYLSFYIYINRSQQMYIGLYKMKLNIAYIA